MGWAVETVSAVDAEIEALPVDLCARLIRLLEAAENVGQEALRTLPAMHLEGRLRDRGSWPKGGFPEGAT